MSFIQSQLRCRILAALSVIGLLFAGSPAILWGQESEELKTNKENAAKTDEDEKATEDPYAVPENASVEELFTFMDAMMKVRPPRGDAQAVADTAKKIFPAIIQAADLVIQKSEDRDTIRKAVLKKFAAYNILVRYDRSVKLDFLTLAEDNANSEDRELAATASGYLLTEWAGNGRGMTPEKAEALSADVLAYLDKFGLDRSTYSVVSSIVRNMGYGQNTETAAQLYEKMVPYFRDSSEPMLVERADSMLGAARRLRLLGNTMDVFGTTADGEPFDWSQYIGKVVLVDFWASWCGPCLGEIPNMKKNLKLYGDRGFEIVGINMDDSRDKFQACVDDREISWVNILSEEEGKTGWKAPMATHYGVTGIPTAILVDQAGKVASLGARGRELDKLLAELLGPPTVEEEEPVKSEDAEGDGQGQSAPDEKLD